MVAYRRNFVPGASYFFTVALRDRRADLLIRHVRELRAAYGEAARKSPFTTDAIVILPDHLHAIWTLPPDDSNYASRWRAIKSGFVRRLARSGMAINRNHRNETGVWQRRYWEHTIRDADDLWRHVEYIHYNPVRHGLVFRAADWPYSSIHRFIEQGAIPPDWASPPDDGVMPALGEPR
jgi:putative transposase